MSSYAARRAENLARNKLALAAIDRALLPVAPPVTGLAPSTPKTPKTPRTPKKEQGAAPQSAPPSTGSRSSSRIRKTVKRFSDEKFSDDEDGYYSVESDSSEEGDHSDSETRPKKKRASQSASGIPTRLVKKGRRNPKVFGHIPGIEVGKWWDSRMACSQDAVHGPPVGGISGNVEVGAWSCAVSGGFPEDIDAGYSFTYTGSGGRALQGTKEEPKNLRTAPQTSDQEFTSFNAALKRSVETGNPVRVIRGFKNLSPFAPLTGYRYDGLYVITRAWMDVGDAGYKVCRYSFARLPGQPDIPIQSGREEEAATILAECGRPDAPQDLEHIRELSRSPVKAALKPTTPIKSPEKRTEAQIAETEAEPMKSPLDSTKRKAVEPVEAAKKVQRTGSRSSPRAPAKKQ